MKYNRQSNRLKYCHDLGFFHYDNSSGFYTFNRDSSDFYTFNRDSSDFYTFNQDSSDFYTFNRDSSDFYTFNQDSSGFTLSTEKTLRKDFQINPHQDSYIHSDQLHIKHIIV